MDKDSHLLFEAYGKAQVAQDFEGNSLKVGDEVEFKTKKPDETVSSGKITKIYGAGKGAVIEVMVQDEYGNLVYKMYGDDALINNSREDKMSSGYGEGEITGYAQYIGRKRVQGENAEGTKIAKIHSNDVWELNPPLKATESRWPDANLTNRGEMKQFPVTVEYLHLQRNKDGEFDAIDAEDPSRSTVVNLPLPQGFNPKASFEEVLKALGYTVTEKDGQAQLNLGENEEECDHDYEDELDKKEAYKASLLRSGENENAESGNLVSPEDFINRIKKDFKSDYHNHHSIYFGKITEGERAGQMYALVYSSEDYSDGDRWLTDEYQQLFYNKLTPDGKWFETSDFLKKEQAKVLEDKAIKEHPELNKDIIDLRKSFNQTNSENAEGKALDAIGNKRVTKEQARQIADKYTNWSHEELAKMSSAYANGFSQELQGVADYNDYEDGTLNFYLYQFGQYEALTSH